MENGPTIKMNALEPSEARFRPATLKQCFIGFFFDLPHLSKKVYSTDVWRICNEISYVFYRHILALSHMGF